MASMTDAIIYIGFIIALYLGAIYLGLRVVGWLRKKLVEMFK